MKSFPYVILYAFVLILACIPLYMVSAEIPSPLASLRVVSVLNLLGWCGVMVFLLARIDSRRRIYKIAKSIGADTRSSSFEDMLQNLLREVSRKNDAFAINLVERKITSKKELSKALEHITALAYKILSAESAELALFDTDSGLYHSSFVLGKPFRSSAQAMLSNAVEGGKEDVSPEVLIHPITFAGNILGSLRVSLKRGKLPNTSDKEVMKLLALQGGMAIINSEFTEKLFTLKRASEESVKAKTGFLANLSHEIRGPLGIMMNAVELVLDQLCGPVSEDQSETLQMVKRNGEHLLDLITDVLDYAKVESGRITPQRTEILVPELLKDMLGVVRAQAEMKKHKLVLKASEEALAIRVDKRHIRQMLINMLTNAIKYTPDGGTIEIWAERVPVNKIRINVKDSGVGIEDAHRHKVFAAFERIENAYSVTQVGTGLGMPLTKKLAEVNGGLIDFRSAPNKGSHFWLLFPSAEYTSQIHLDQETEELEVKGNGDSILLIERDQGERAMLSKYLSHLGFNVSACGSKAEAAELLRQKPFQLVIVDNNAADDHNDDLLSGLRENSKVPAMPVMLISSRAFAFDIEKYLKAGVDRCIIKPIALKKLSQTCRELINGTYRGAVIDSSELDIGAKAKEKKPQESNPTRTKVMQLDDILH